MLTFVQFEKLNIVFMFGPGILDFDVEADLWACAVNRHISILAFFIVFLIDLAVVFLGTGLNGFVARNKNCWIR